MFKVEFAHKKSASTFIKTSASSCLQNLLAGSLSVV